MSRVGQKYPSPPYNIRVKSLQKKFLIWNKLDRNTTRAQRFWKYEATGTIVYLLARHNKKQAQLKRKNIVVVKCNVRVAAKGL